MWVDILNFKKKLKGKQNFQVLLQKKSSKKNNNFFLDLTLAFQIFAPQMWANECHITVTAGQRELNTAADITAMMKNRFL